MPRIRKKTKRIAFLISVLTSAAILATGYVQVQGKTIFDDFVFFAVIAAVIPYALMSYIDYRWRRAIDDHLPDLFRSIVQAQETGITLPQALEEAAKRDYGPLTAELRKMTAQMSWGKTFEEALQMLGNRVDTVMVQRTIPLIIEASRSGGRIEKVFDPTGKFIQTTLLLEKERRTQTRPYIAIIYVAFFVFVFTIVLLFKSFFTTLEGLPTLGSSVVSPDEMQRIFFHMTVIQAFFGGLASGKMAEGALSAGLKHSLILMITGYIALKIFL